jgi:hypothetical protein
MIGDSAFEASRRMRLRHRDRQEGLGPAGGNEGRTASAVARGVARPYGRIGTCPARDSPVKLGRHPSTEIRIDPSQGPARRRAPQAAHPTKAAVGDPARSASRRMRPVLPLRRDPTARRSQIVRTAPSGKTSLSVCWTMVAGSGRGGTKRMAGGRTSAGDGL